MLAKEKTSLIGKLPTPGKGWSLIIILKMKEIYIEKLGLIEVQNPKEISGGFGYIAFQIGLYAAVGAVVLGAFLAGKDAACNC